MKTAPPDITKMNIIRIFEKAADDFPNDLAIKGIDFSFSYKEFDAITFNFAQRLMSLNVQSEDIIGLCLDRSPEMLAGIFGILRAGAAYLPVDATHPPNRISSILNDAGVKWIVTTSDLSDFVSQLGFFPLVPDCSLITKLSNNDLAPISDNSTAYVLFTSGSTGTPKGVIIAHASVANLIQYMQSTYPLSKGDVVMLKSPYTFDGSVWELFGWMIMGGTLFVAPRGSEKDPRRLSEIIEKEHISFLFFVPSMLNAFISWCKVNRKDFMKLKWVSVGGEVLSVKLVDEFYKLFDYEKVKLINVYGPTETTVYAATYCCMPIADEVKIPVGKPVVNNFIYILDDRLQPVADGEEGEICIGGAGVGKGYLNRQELTDEKFVPDTLSGVGKMYLTGDIGRKVESGDFDFIGRRDFQIKLRGLRIEIGEIEHALLQIGEIAECVVLVTKDSRGDDSLTAYLRKHNWDKSQTADFYQASKSCKDLLLNKLRQWLPDYMIPSEYFIYNRFPLTAHEKIDRAALVKPQNLNIGTGETEMVYRTETEAKIASLWKQVLGKNNIGIHDDFFETGGHSLKVVQLITSIITAFGVEVPMDEFYRGITISSMAERIDNKLYNQVHNLFSPPGLNAGQTVFPLTPVQSEMWIVNSLDATGLTHNIQIEFTLTGKPDIDRFKQSVIRTIKNEEMFRSVFKVYDEQPVQQVFNDVEFVITEEDLGQLSADEKSIIYDRIVFSNGNTLFELGQLPLFKFILIRWSENEHRLLMAVHHIIFDGWSLHLFMQRVAKYYKSGETDTLHFRNADYALYLRQPGIQDKILKELDYWEKTLNNITDELTLPQKSKIVQAENRKKGCRFWWSLDPELSVQVEQFALSARTTPYVVFMTAYQLALATAANQHDIVIGSPLANRNNELITNLIGYYTNMVCIRGAWNRSDSMSKAVEKCNNRVINAFLNSTVSYGEVVKHLNKSVERADKSLFHAIFVMQNWPHDNLNLPGFSFIQREIGNNTSKTGFLLNVEKQEDIYVCWLEYDTGLYTSAQAAQLADAIRHSLQIATSQPALDIQSITDSLKPYFDIVAHPTCYVVGEGKIAAYCIGLLIKSGLKVCRVISVDEWLLNEFKDNSVHASLLSEIGLQLAPVDYIFSINNSIILKEHFLSLAKILAVNYHDAPLPHYAGMYATSWAIINGENVHGISWHMITGKVDAGDILESTLVKIDENDTAFSLNTKCFDAAILSFEKLVEAINNGMVHASPQDLSHRSYFGLSARPPLFGCLSPNQTVAEIDRMLRATEFGFNNDNEFMLPSLYLNNRFYVVTKATVFQTNPGHVGLVANVDGKRGFYCMDGFIVPETIYSANGDKISTEELLPLNQEIRLPDHKILASVAAYFAIIAKYERYWKRQLLHAGYASWPILMGDHSKPEAQFFFDQDTTRLLAGFAPEYEIKDIVTAIFGLYLLRLNDTDTGTFGLVPTPAGYTEELQASGFFSNHVPVNMNFGRNDDVYQAVKNILPALRKVHSAHTFTQSIYYRYAELSEKVIFHPAILFVNEMDDVPDAEDGHVLILPANACIRIYTNNAVKFAGIEAILNNFRFFLNNLLLCPTTIFSELPLASRQILSASLEVLQVPCADRGDIKNVVGSFWEMVQKYPDNTAVFDTGRHYSYKTFSEDIDKLSACLKNTGVGAGSVVAVSIDRTYYYFVSIMAILQNGAAFLTIDPKIPGDRKKYICENAGASVLLLKSKQDTFSDGLQELIVPDLLAEKIDSRFNRQSFSADAIAYIIYTSGSSGLPKGVKISNRNLANFLSGAIRLYKIDPNDRILQFSSLSFDACIEEIFCSFCTGASLFLRTEEMLQSDELLQFVDEQRITVLDLPTTYWRQVIHTNAMASLSSRLKRIIIGGEALTQADVDFWRSTNPHYELINTYGPTETTVVALASYISPTQGEIRAVPIGRPLPGYFPFIVDRQNNILPCGLAGELLIAGDSVSPGYIDQQNNKAFVWLNTPAGGLIRCYCTGDRVYSDKNGIVYFIGRNDAQLKIRGYRVEPAEVESQICKVDGIVSSVVLPEKGSDGEIKLVAFYLTEGQVVDNEKLKSILKDNLPAYMVPGRFISMPDIPLTISGKVDKDKLMALAKIGQEDTLSDMDKPTNETEAYLLSLWQKLLGISQIGIHDDFFEIGGHSLKAVGLMAEIRKDKGLKIPLATLIQHSTISKLAPLIQDGSNQGHWSCLVPIRTEGTKTPIFLIHGAGLNVLFYKTLSNFLSPGRPIYAFQASGLDGSRPIKGSIDEMAAEYIEEMLRVQPQGSYILIGLSLGGFIAYEMAIQLTKMGKKAKFTGLIDSVSYLANYSSTFAEKFVVETKSFVIRPFYLLWLFFNLPDNERRMFLINKRKNFRQTVLFYLTKMGIVKLHKADNDIEQLSFLSDSIMISLGGSLKKYKLKPADFHIDLFMAGKSTFYIYDRKTYGWAKFAKGGLSVHVIPGEHSLLFAAPNDLYFAEVLGKRLTEIDAEQVHEMVSSQ